MYILKYLKQINHLYYVIIANFKNTLGAFSDSMLLLKQYKEGLTFFITKKR